MDLSPLFRLRVTNFLNLSSGKDQIQPRIFYDKQHLRGTPQATPPTSRSLLLLSSSGVAAVANDSFRAAVAAMYLPFQTCRRRILLQASRAEFGPR